MAKRYLLYLRLQPNSEDGLRVLTIDEQITKSMWPDGCIYFSVHEKSVKWTVDVNGVVSESVRLDKFPTFDEELMKSIILTTIERIKQKGYMILMNSKIMNEECSEAMRIVTEIRKNKTK